MTGKRGTDDLTDAQRRFAEEYLVDFNESGAYLRAGYKARGHVARINANRLLNKASVQAYLRTRNQELLAKLEVSQEEVLRRVAVLAMADRRQLYDENNALKPIHELTLEQASLIQGIEVFEEFEGSGKDRKHIGQTTKVKIVNTLDSLRTLGGHFGLFSKKVVHTDPKTDAAGKTTKSLEDLMNDIDGAGTGLPKPLRGDAGRNG